MTPRTTNQDHRTDRESRDWPLSRRGLLKAGALSTFGGMPGLAAAKGEGRGPYPAPVPVLDTEDDDPDPAFVVWSTDIPISDWTVYGDETVADHNPNYDPDEPVVIVVFEDLLEAGWQNWRRAKPFELFSGVVDRGIKFHAFPRSRLEIRKRRGKGKGR